MTNVVHAHCDGCQGEIKEDAENIVMVIKGKVCEIDCDEMGLRSEKSIWFGHASCHEQPILSAQVFLRGNVFQELCKKFNDNKDRENIIAHIIELFTEKNWPLKEG